MKKWYSSKTIWVAIITLVYGVLRTTGIVDQELPDSTVTIILGGIVFILRLLTKDPLFNLEDKRK